MLASISLDLDNKWSYLKTHGDEGWDSYPTYLPMVVPKILDMLDRVSLTITFFIVGLDASRTENQEALRSIAEANHEIGNHSFNHEPWLHLYSRSQLIEEFEKTEQAIFDCTDQKTIGFRGPGFSYSREVLEVLSERGYRYDASTFPTFLGPVARAFYFFNSGLSREDRKQRKQLFGSFSEGFKSLRPYRWDRYGLDLVEMPVTTMPWFKVPVHFSYVMYLASYSPALARAYFYSAMNFCWLNRVEPSLLLHPLDFMGCDDDKDLAFFPGMSSTSETKLKIAEELLSWMASHFQCVTMSDHAAKYAQIK